MKSLQKEQLQQIWGGSATASLIVLGLLALTTIIAGVIDGYVRPKKCNE